MVINFHLLTVKLFLLYYFYTLWVNFKFLSFITLFNEKLG
jgi:hypothetical protein